LILGLLRQGLDEKESDLNDQRARKQSKFITTSSNWGDAFLFNRLWI
jgi:hypothetical protein